MDPSEVQSFASQWIEVNRKSDPRLGSKNPLKHSDPDTEIIFRMFDIVGSDWRDALAVAIEIANQTDDPWILELLGSGALEDLLESRGEAVLPLFLAAAKTNPAFQQALRHVWESNTPEAWERFKRVRDKLEL